MKGLRHFLRLNDCSSDELEAILARAVVLKKIHYSGALHEPLKNKTLAMIFEKSSTRTRISFEAGMTQLGGHALFLSPNDTQLGRGEPIADSSRVMSSMVDGIMLRTFEHTRIEEFARFSSVPVINALTDSHHPCQLLADIMTWKEQQGDIKGCTAVYIGDGNNMCHSWMEAAVLFDFNLRVATPTQYQPDADLLAESASHVSVMTDAMAAVQSADVVITDTWVSMGQEEEKAQRIKEFEGFKVTDAMMREAADHAIFMHCLPAYRGLEVAESVIDGSQSVVWDEAENRLHAQKALLEFLLNPSPA